MNKELDSISDAEDWLLRGKFEPQRSLVPDLSRGRLIQQLEKSRRGALTLLATPAGYGKSTLLAQWLDHMTSTSCSASWLTVDGNDCEPLPFLSHLIMSISYSGTDLGVLEKLAEQGLIELSRESAISALAAALGRNGQPLVIVIDDYHRIAGESLDRVIEALLAVLPDHVHLAVASRNKPDFRYSALKLDGRVQEFGVDDLRFTATECSELFVDHGGTEIVDVLMQRTEGWAVALQLARSLVLDTRSLDGLIEGVSGRASDIGDYFTQQIFRDMSAEIRSVLLQTAILERFNADLANAVCSRSDCLGVLEELKRRHSLIISTGREPVWYRYHHLLQEFLIGELNRREPEHVSVYHRRAAIWYREHALFADAVRHYCAADDIDAAASVVEDAGGWELIMFGGIPLFRRFGQHFPRNALDRFPRVAIADVYRLMKDGHMLEAHQQFAKLRELNAHLLADTTNATAPLRRDFCLVELLLKVYEDKLVSPSGLEEIGVTEAALSPSDSTGRAVLNAAAAVVTLGLGDFIGAHEHALLTARHMREVNCVLGINYALIHQGQANLNSGHLREALATLTDAIEMAEDNFGADSGLKAIAEVVWDSAKYVRDESGLSEDNFLASLSHMEHYDGWTEVYIVAYTTAAARAYASGGIERTHSMLSRGFDTAENRGLPRLSAYLSALEYFYLVRTGSYDEAQQLTRHPKYIASMQNETRHWRTDHLMGAAEILLRLQDGDMAAASERALRLVETAKSIGSQIHLLQASLLVAAAHDGNLNTVYEQLRPALKMGALEGIRSPVTELGAKVHAVLQSIYQSRRDLQVGSLVRRYLEERLEKFRTDSSTWNSEVEPSPLSPRETEVLEELVLGLSNKEIARSLDMTENTVKFHLKNIFSKLGVDKRMRAVAVAHERGLVGRG